MTCEGCKWELFLFSVLLYLLMRRFRSRGRSVLSILSDLLALPGAVYALVLPATLLAVLLDYGTTEHNAGRILIGHLWLTLAGPLIVPDERLQASIQRLR